jgi:hypothetical protein
MYFNQMFTLMFNTLLCLIVIKCKNSLKIEKMLK